MSGLLVTGTFSIFILCLFEVLHSFSDKGVANLFENDSLAGGAAVKLACGLELDGREQVPPGPPILPSLPPSEPSQLL